MVSKFLKNIIGLLPLPILTFFVKNYVNLKKSYPSLFGKDKALIIDKDGIPFLKLGNIQGVDLGNQRNPVTISQKAFEYYEDYLKNNNKKSKKFFINNANWLVKNVLKCNNHSILLYLFPWPKYALPKPWCSGMAQGQAIQVLVKAHRITHDINYLDTAKSLLNAFFVEVKDGGVTYKDSEDRWWYEEYANENGKSSRVLNGMIYALFGIYEYYTYTNDMDSKFLFEQGIRALKNDLPNYDCASYSYYDILKNPASKYHLIHVNQLKKLFEISKEPIFKKYYDSWNNFDYFKNLAISLFKRNNN